MALAMVVLLITMDHMYQDDISYRAIPESVSRVHRGAGGPLSGRRFTPAHAPSPSSSSSFTSKQQQQQQSSAKSPFKRGNRTPASAFENDVRQLLIDIGFYPTEVNIPLIFLPMRKTPIEIKYPNHTGTLLGGEATALPLSMGDETFRIPVDIPNFSLSDDYENLNLSAGDVSIGVTTYSARAQQSIDMTQFTLANQGVDVHFFLDDKDERELAYSKYIRRPDNMKIYTSGHGSGATRWFHMVGQLHRLNPNAKFYLISDDDTQFFLTSLLRVLSRFDPDVPVYIGHHSELSHPTEKHGMEVRMAFGGGGAVISRAAMDRMVPILSGCEERYKSVFGGDERLARCLADVGVLLTEVSAFHQFDARGNLVGLYEHVYDIAAMHRPFSVFLWPFEQGEVQWARLAKLQKNADYHYLRRMVWNTTIKGGTHPVVLTNGYTVTFYTPTLFSSNFDYDTAEETFSFYALSDSGSAYSMKTQNARPSHRYFWDAVIYESHNGGPRRSVANVYKADRFGGIVVVYCDDGSQSGSSSSWFDSARGRGGKDDRTREGRKLTLERIAADWDDDCVLKMCTCSTKEGAGKERADKQRPPQWEGER
ncbi:hypothetical protein HK101_001286 [Irineochytrium annulatum]|nr:hypothetical protein HK101_001286 [Irineochytrium annulatum]